jgi:hypothetical protein
MAREPRVWSANTLLYAEAALAERRFRRYLADHIRRHVIAGDEYRPRRVRRTA